MQDAREISEQSSLILRDALRMNAIDGKTSARSTYIPLAQKWRSQTFDDVVGQDLSVKILKNSLYRETLFPVYLFAGQRGCGKTSMARIFASALQCEKYTQFQKDPQTCMPCTTCPTCCAVREGSHPDVIEIDAASHTGVENIRGLIDAAMFFPALGKWKVYVIDEAHMLSRAAFNALLKILEEPPRHVIFILATTDYSKIIDTVRSRCFQMFFDPIDQRAVVKRLQQICIAENITYDDSALAIIAQHCEGSLRDAITLLERVSFAYAHITPQDVYTTLGIASDELVKNIWQAIIAAHTTVSHDNTVQSNASNKTSQGNNTDCDAVHNNGSGNTSHSNSVDADTVHSDEAIHGETILQLLDQAATSGVQPERLWKQCIEQPCTQGWLLAKNNNLYLWLTPLARIIVQKTLVALCERESMFIKTAHKYAFLKIIFLDVLDAASRQSGSGQNKSTSSSQSSLDTSNTSTTKTVNQNKSFQNYSGTAMQQVQRDGGFSSVKNNNALNKNSYASGSSSYDGAVKEAVAPKESPALWEKFLSSLQQECSDISLQMFFKQALSATLSQETQTITLAFSAGGEFGRDYIIERSGMWTPILHTSFGAPYALAYTISKEQSVQPARLQQTQRSVSTDNIPVQKKMSKKNDTMQPTATLFHDVFGGELGNK